MFLCFPFLFGSQCRGLTTVVALKLGAELGHQRKNGKKEHVFHGFGRALGRA